MNYPGISILMPTYNRNNFFELALDNILSQNYPREKLEWIIIDDGEKNFIEDEDNIRDMIFPIKLKYLRIDPKNKISIGEKRNLLVNYCEYDYCINMDDDDIYLDDYIINSINQLIKNDVGLVGSNQMIFYFHKYNKFTKIICGQKRQIHEGTMCFTKDHWKKTGGFLNRPSGEGPKMIDGYEEFVYNENIDNLMYCLCHDNNTYSKKYFFFKPEIKIELNPKKSKIINKINF